MKNYRMKNSLFIKLAGILLLVLLILGTIMGKVGYDSSIEHHNEANQRLHKDLAQFTVDHVETFDEKGNINEAALGDIMHSMMVINPDVEVYLLDKQGEIIKHVAPKKKVVRSKVDLAPINKFLKEGIDGCIAGDDPRSDDGKKVFSVAPIMKNDILQGYYYIILASQERASVLESLKSHIAISYWLKMSLVAFLMAFAIGLFALWRFTKNLSPIESSMKAFQEGDYDSRIKDNTGDFKPIALAYNSMADQIQMNFDKIKSVDQFRKEFIANISHDLRSPMVVVKGYAETMMIKGEELSLEERNKYLNYIVESSKQSEGLLNQLLELSKLENNQIEVSLEPFDLKELISDLLGRFELIMKKKNIQVAFNSAGHVNLVYGDISLIERAVMNLLDNAIKYSPENSTISLNLEEKNKMVYCSISDQGIGIEEQKLAKIFERYERGPEVNSENKSMGLGLAIVKRIIEMHDATINVKSKLNQGATFTFNLRVA